MSKKSEKPKSLPALDPESRENQLISLAVNLAEEKLRDGTASNQLIVHYLKLGSTPWPATKEELIDYATRTCAPDEVIENLEELDDDTEIYESIEDIWPDYPTKEDFLFNEDEY